MSYNIADFIVLHFADVAIGKPSLHTGQRTCILVSLP